MNKVIVPKYAKATVDKKLLCLVCGVVVKNITMWSMKHIKSEEHIKKVKEYEEKEKTKPNIDNNKIIKEKEEQKKKQLSEIEMKKQQVRNKLMESLNETNDDYELNLPENFFDNNRDKEANINKEENTKKKVMTKPIPVKEEKKEDNDISSDSESITSEYEGEVDSMINCATKVNNIISHYVKPKIIDKQPKELIKHKRQRSTKEETKEELLSIILND